MEEEMSDEQEDLRSIVNELAKEEVKGFYCRKANQAAVTVITLNTFV